MKISVAIITRNRGNVLVNSLASLTKQVIRPYEVLVVDNDSHDATKEVVDYFKKKLPVRYVKEKKVGIPYARNRAIKEAKGDILVFIDDDVTVDENWLIEVIKAHTKYKSAIAIQGYSIGMPRDNIYARILEYYQNFWLHHYMYISFEEYKLVVRNKKNGYKIQTLVTRNCSLKLSRLKHLGVDFDTHFLSKGEDADLANMLLLKKQTIVFCPTIVCNNWDTDSLMSFLIKGFKGGEARWFLDRKWKGKTQINFKRLTFNFVYMLKIRGYKFTNVQSTIWYISLFYLYMVLIFVGYLYKNTERVFYKTVYAFIIIKKCMIKLHKC